MAMLLRSVVCASPVTYCAVLSIPMWKLSTGEPCAGEPHARFGGRGGRALFPTPINLRIEHVEPPYGFPFSRERHLHGNDIFCAPPIVHAFQLKVVPFDAGPVYLAFRRLA